jgi:predicted double-glycine peptidase
VLFGNWARAIAFVALAASAAGASEPRVPPVPVASTTSLLDVPYLPQTQQLCGGAAVAMVLRYWGERNVFPQDFASLVDASESGIRTSALAEDVTKRGWQAVSATPDAAVSRTFLAGEIAKGRPVIALIEVAPRTYHYVVVVGVTADNVVYHDPARAPFRIVPIREFDRQWTAANRWALLVLPAAGRTLVNLAPAAAAPSMAAERSAASTPCSALIAQNVKIARDGQLEEAERGFLAAQSLCPADSSLNLELGGLRFLQRNYAEAEALATNVLTSNPRDETAWDLLATSRYLQGDLHGALEAWNEIGRPRAEVVRVEGVERLDHPVIVRKTGLEPREPITASDFARAERRLNELPTIKNASLNFFPQGDGSADVRAVLSERSVLPRGAVGWAAVGVNSAFRRELRLLVASPLKLGETWDVRYRWRTNRPRVRVAFSAPAPGFLPGVIGVEGLWERQSYQPADDPLRQERRRVDVFLSDWLTDRIRWTAGGAADDFDGRRFFTAHAQVDTRWFNDHVSTMLAGGYWTPAGDDRGFATAHAQIAWRSSRNPATPEWLGRAGMTFVGAAAPLAVWPIAGSGESRGPLLRAHELHSDGIVVSEVFGRRLAFASLEYQHPVYSKKGATVAIAGFGDAGRSWDRPFSPDPSPFHVDAGVGLRVNAPGSDDQLRIDFAYGLRDGRRTISAGYVLPFGQ